MKLDLDQIERLALNTSPSEWKCEARHIDAPEADLDAVSRWPDDEWLGYHIEGLTLPPGRGDFVGRDAAFIVAVRPQVVLELIRLARIGVQFEITSERSTGPGAV